MKVLISSKISPHRYETPEGYLVCVDCVLSRTGKQTYRKNEVFDTTDETEIEIDRTEDEVFSSEALASFENKPLTLEHPDEQVNIDNYKEYSIGYVRDIRRGTDDGKPVMIGNIVITDKDAIDAVKNHRIEELSCGYDCDIVDEENPQQRNIRGNHVALCECGRAGNARIIDSKCKDFDDTGKNIRVVKEFIERNGNKFDKRKDAAAILEYIKKRTGIANADYGDVLYIIKEYTRAEITDSVNDESITVGEETFELAKTAYGYVLKNKDKETIAEFDSKQEAMKEIAKWRRQGYIDDSVKDRAIPSGYRNFGSRYSWELEGRAKTSQEAIEKILRKFPSLNNDWGLDELLDYMVKHDQDNMHENDWSINFDAPENNEGHFYFSLTEKKERYNDSIEDVDSRYYEILKKIAEKYTIAAKAQKNSHTTNSDLRYLGKKYELSSDIRAEAKREWNKIVNSLSPAYRQVLGGDPSMKKAEEFLQMTKGELAKNDSINDKLVEPSRDDIMKFENLLRANKIEIERKGKTLFGNVHYQVLYWGTEKDLFKKLNMIDDQMDKIGIPMTYATGYDPENNQASAGVDLYKKSVKDTCETEDATGHEVVVRTNEVLKEMGKNNWIGKYDRVVQACRNLFGEGFLTGEELKNAIRREVPRLLKKYNLEDSKPEIMKFDYKGKTYVAKKVEDDITPGLNRLAKSLSLNYKFEVDDRPEDGRRYYKFRMENKKDAKIFYEELMKTLSRKFDVYLDAMNGAVTVSEQIPVSKDVQEKIDEVKRLGGNVTGASYDRRNNAYYINMSDNSTKREKIAEQLQSKFRYRVVVTKIGIAFYQNLEPWDYSSKS